MTKSTKFLKDFLSAYRLERFVDIEVIQKKCEGRSSIHIVDKVYDNEGCGENLSVAIEDAEKLFYIVLHVDFDSLRLVIANGNNWENFRNERKFERFVIPDGFYTAVSSEAEFKYFVIDSEDYTIKLNVQCTSENDYQTKVRRLRGELIDIHHQLEFYNVQAKFTILSTGEVKTLEKLKDRGLNGRTISYVYFSNENDDEYEEKPLRQTLRLEVSDGIFESQRGCKDSYAMEVSVFPEFHDEDVKREEGREFYARRIFRKYSSEGMSITLEDDSYSVELIIRYDSPLPFYENDTAKRFLN